MSEREALKIKPQKTMNELNNLENILYFIDLPRGILSSVGRKSPELHCHTIGNPARNTGESMNQKKP